jgi:hypothetical protein
LACFDVSTGQVIWRRKDLKKFYGLSFSRARNSLFAYFDGKSALELDPLTGVTQTEFRGVVEVDTSPYDESLLFAERKKFSFFGKELKRLWSVPRESFAVLGIAWSTGSVAISEVGSELPNGHRAGIRCYSLGGELLWRYQGQNDHIDAIQYRPRTKSFVGVDFTAGKAYMLVELDEDTGNAIHQKIIPTLPHWGFCENGEQFFSVDHISYEVTIKNF